METQEIYRSEIRLKDAVNSNSFLLNEFSDQRHDAFKSKHSISLKDIDFLEMMDMDDCEIYTGNKKEIEKMLRFQNAQRNKFEELEKLKKMAEKLEREIIENCKILEGVSEVF